MQSISTSTGVYDFSPVRLYHGRGAIDSEVARGNLLALQRTLDAAGIRFGIIYGTLLGAVRGGAFIPWDEDVDVFLLDEDRASFHNVLFELRDQGLELVRMEGDLYSLMRDNNYIDVYVFRRVRGRRVCNADVVMATDIESDEWIDFLGSKFRTPHSRESFLARVYGRDWRTPKQNCPARPWPFLKRVKEMIKERAPFLVRLKKLLLLR